jgi:dihydroflavonol-4-reductase
MLAAIAEAVGTAPPGLRLPLAPLLAAASVLEVACRPLRIPPPLHRRRMDFFRKSFHLDGTKAAERLGFRPSTRFLEGAHRTAAWYRAQGLLEAALPGPQGPRRTSSRVSVTMPARWLAKTMAATGRSSTP